jgi:spermidine synthase
MLRSFVFACGAVLMSLEILGSRVLAPQYGNSVIVWGSLIGVFLGALSLGYWLGGRLADRVPRAEMIAGLVAGSGLFVVAIPTIAPFVFGIAGDSVRIGSLSAAMALFFIPSLMLGAVSPYAIRLEEARMERLGRAAGGLYAISTLGSIIGTIATAFWLLPLAGVPTLIRALGFILIFSSAGLMLWSMPSIRFGRLAAVAAGGFVAVVGAAVLIVEASSAHAKPHGTKETLVFEKDTFYHHIRITDDGDVRELHFDNSNQSAIYKSKPLVSAYGFTEYLHLGRVLVPDPKNVLVIGLGGGIVAHQLLAELPHAQIDCAEIDPEVIDVARRYFDFPQSDPRLRVAAEDGRRFLTKSDRRYDMIIVDAFYKDSVPFHLVTREFYALCRQKMTPHGVLVLNMVGTARGPRSALFASIYRTLGSSFTERYVFERFVNITNIDNQLRNCFIIAGQQTKMSQEQLDAAFAAAQARGLSETYLQHKGDYLSREPDNYLSRDFTDDYAPVDDLISFTQQ